MPNRPIRVLVAEDSITARDLLVSICRSDPAIEVVGEAPNGEAAVEMTKRLRPSLVIMDIHMPVLDGFEATKRIMVEVPTPIIIVTAATNLRDVEVSLRAVQLGALTILPKPSLVDGGGFNGEARRLVSLVKALSEVKVVRRRRLPGIAEGATPPPSPPVRDGKVRLVAAAASTGGPAALYRLLERLPRDIGVPFVVVQHIADGFGPGLVAWLNSGSPLPVKLVEHGELLLAGTVYVAPPQRHARVRRDGTVALSGDAPVCGFRPSATVLFQSVAEAYGEAAAGVILTGMGTDGLEGLRALRHAGGCVLAQDEESSVVFGMPGAVVQAGLAHVVAPIETLAQSLSELTARRSS